MLKGLIGLLAAGVLAIAAAETVNSTKLETEWDTACYWTSLLYNQEDICVDIEAPNVVYSPELLMRIVGFGGMGFYIYGENNIYVSPPAAKMFGEPESYVIIHEMVHYIIHEKFGRDISRCDGEEAARMVTDLHAGRPYTSTWRSNYNCTP